MEKLMMVQHLISGCTTGCQMGWLLAMMHMQTDTVCTAGSTPPTQPTLAACLLLPTCWDVAQGLEAVGAFAYKISGFSASFNLLQQGQIPSSPVNILNNSECDGSRATSPQCA